MNQIELERKVKKNNQEALNRHSEAINRIKKIETAVRRAQYDKTASELREELLATKQLLAQREAFIEGLLKGIDLMKQ